MRHFGFYLSKAKRIASETHISMKLIFPKADPETFQVERSASALSSSPMEEIVDSSSSVTNIKSHTDTVHEETQLLSDVQSSERGLEDGDDRNTAPSSRQSPGSSLQSSSYTEVEKSKSKTSKFSEGSDIEIGEAPEEVQYRTTNKEYISIDEIIADVKRTEQEVEKKVRLIMEEPGEPETLSESAPSISSSRFTADIGIVSEPVPAYQSASTRELEEINWKQALPERVPDNIIVSEPLPDYKSTSSQKVEEAKQNVAPQKRVEHRLLQAQEKQYKPGTYDSDSELNPLTEKYLEMKLRLNLLVKAAEEYHISTCEQRDARTKFFQEMVDFSSDTLLNGYVEFVGWNNTTDSPQNTVDYGDTILQHTKEWQDTVTSMVDSAFAEYKLLEQQCLHYKTKTGRLRRYSRRVKSLRFSFAADKLEKKFERNYDKMQDTTDRCKQKADELCFLLDQVSKYGWNDVYSLVKSTMEWEADRLEQEKQEFGAELPHAVERLTTLFPMAENEVATKPESIYGFSDTIHGELPNIDPSKPTLFLDDACPFTARVWITLLEKELDPSNPIGFHAIPVCSIDPQDTGYQMLQKLEIESSPFLMHMGNVFSESIRVAEYIDLLSNSHFVPSLQPSDQIGAFNMRTFIDRHAQIAEVFFSLMDTEDEDAKPDLAKEMFDLLRLIDKDLRKFNGPYLCGNCFSLADVNVYPFVEHIKAILSTFGSFSIPASLTALLEWYDTISKRPSIQIVTADRSIDGGKRNSSFKELKRNDYLVEYHQYRIDLGREYASEVTGSGDTADDEDSYYVNIPSLMPSLVELDTKPLEA